MSDQAGMLRTTSSRLVLGLLSSAALASTACGAFSGDSGSSSAPETQAPAADPDAGGVVGHGPKAPPAEGPTNPGELTDELGIFVTTAGSDSATGTHDQPLATIQAGIDKAKTVGKRVYVCSGTFKEALTLADSISVIGGLDCRGSEWKVGAARTRVEAPTSPAIRAAGLTSPTRLEGLDVIAPDATTPSGSSIGLLATKSPALVVASTKIAAGAAMKGDDGQLPIQLTNAATVNGGGVPGSAVCNSSLCPNDFGTSYYASPAGGVAGTNTCVGAPGIVAAAGGAGGTGGLFETYISGVSLTVQFRLYRQLARYDALPGTVTTSQIGADGVDGSNAPATIAVSSEGYAPSNGVEGKAGGTGSGGSGGSGVSPTTNVTPVRADEVWRGWGGAGGGAGGCPGLPGGAGKGGGASIAALLIESPVTFDGAQLLAGRGGDGGKGTLGSMPTAGGAAGSNALASSLPALSAKPGGRGGYAGISGNGSSGPAIGIAHQGAAPTMSGGSTAVRGSGGAAIAPRSATASGVTKTVPATPPGVEADILPL